MYNSELNYRRDRLTTNVVTTANVMILQLK